MKSVIRSGKTVDEAIDECLKALSTTRDKVEVEVLEEAKSGILGIIGRKDAMVRVILKEGSDLVDEILKDAFSDDKKEGTSKKIASKVEEKEDLEEIENQTSEVVKKEDNIIVSDEELGTRAKALLESILAKMDVKADIKISQGEENLNLEIVGADQRDTGIIIGRRGETLDAIQYLLSLTENKNRSEYIRVTLDINGYREKREESLVSLAHKMAEKAVRTGRNIRLEPMNPYERRIIHSALQDNEGIFTSSEGKEPYRKVVIRVKK